MPERSQLNWTPYQVGDTVGGASCRRLRTVMHVTHVNAALTILRDGTLKPQLIYDESRLNTQRILVGWLSPNDWTNAGGFRYGNIAFELDWPDLVNGMRFYWVGSMPYRPVACRILITGKNRNAELKPYAPSLRDGPWWRSETTGRHYWNGEYCLEFMLEEEIPLHEISRLRFVEHHPHRCSVDPARCSECGNAAGRGAARLLAGACDRRLLARSSSLWVDADAPTEALKFAWDELRGRVGTQNQRWRGLLDSQSVQAAAVARAAMGAYCDRAMEDKRHLLSFFESWDEAIEACASVIETDLQLAADTLLRSDDDE